MANPAVTVDLLANPSGLTQGLTTARGALSQFQGSTNSAGSAMGSIAGSMGGLIAKLGALAAAYMGVKAAAGVAMGALEEAAGRESLQAEMKIMLGGGEEGEAKMKAMVKELADFAASTPFELGQLADSAKLMMNFGVPAKDVMKNIQMMGDVSGSNAEKFKSISLAFSQVQAAGKLMGQDLMQFVNAGFNPLKVLAESSGVSMADMRKKMEKGGVSALDVSKAFEIATSKGGLFFGNMKEQSKTWVGLMSTLSDNWKEFQIQFMTPIMDQLKPLLLAAGESMKGLATWGASVGKQIGQGLGIIIAAIQSGQLSTLFSQAVGIGFKEGVNFLYAAIQGIGAGLGAMVVEAFSVLTDGNFGLGLIGIFQGIGNYLQGIPAVFAISFGMKLNEAFRPFHENFVGLVIFVGDRLKATFQGVGLILKEAFLNAASALLGAIAPAASVLGFGDEVEAAKAAAESGATVAGRDFRELQGEEAMAFSAPPGEKSGWDKAKDKAKVGLDTRDAMMQTSLDYAKSKLEQGTKDFAKGFELVTPKIVDSAGKVTAAFMGAVGSADKIFDTSKDKDALAQTAASLLPKDKKAAAAAGEGKEKDAVAAGTAAVAGVVDSMQSIGGGGNASFSVDPLVAEGEKQTAALEKIVSLMGEGDPSMPNMTPDISLDKPINMEYQTTPKMANVGLDKPISLSDTTPKFGSNLLEEGGTTALTLGGTGTAADVAKTAEGIATVATSGSTAVIEGLSPNAGGGGESAVVAVLTTHTALFEKMISLLEGNKGNKGTGEKGFSLTKA